MGKYLFIIYIVEGGVWCRKFIEDLCIFTVFYGNAFHFYVKYSNKEKTTSATKQTTIWEIGK